MSRILLRSRPRAPEKHVEYFAVLDACSQDGCPLCRLSDTFAKRSIEEILYEEVNDPDVRKRLRESRGYCKRHAALLLRAGDGFGTAIIYKDILASVRSEIEKGKVPKDSAECPLCSSGERYEQNCVGVISKHINDDDLKKALEGSDGFCLQHLSMVLTAVDDTARKYIAALHVRKLTILADRLGEFIRKHNYRFHDEQFTDEEAHSWQRAVRFVTGDEE